MIDTEQTVNLLKDLVAINSENPSLSGNQNNENKIAEYLGQYLSELGLEVSYQETEGRKNVIGVLKGSGGGNSLILNAHTDTVSIEGMEDPLDPVEKDGRIYGRGAYDMKGGLASCVLALASIITDEIELRGDVIFAGVVDEEYASLGTEELVKEYDADAAIITEPTNSRIVIANKGFSWIKITVHGKASHGSKPHLGIDAIAKATKVLNAIQELQQELHTRDHQYVGTPDIRVNKIKGGLGLSTISDSCTLYVERRTHPKVTQKEVEQEIGTILENISKEDPEFDADYEMIIFRGGLELSKDEAIVQGLAEQFEAVTGRSPEFSGEPWWMDSALMGEHGIPTVVLGPNGDGAHAKIEYVEIDSVIEIAHILKKTIVNYCS